MESIYLLPVNAKIPCLIQYASKWGHIKLLSCMYMSIDKRFHANLLYTTELF